GLLAANLAQFEKPGVLSVRPGWKFDPRGMTGERAIVVTVLPEKAAELAGALPTALAGVPVDVRQANPLQQMRAQRPLEYLAVGAARHEVRQPDFDDEVFFDAAGKPMAPAAPLAAFAAAHAQKPQIPYSPAPATTLDAVTGPVSLVLHA